MSSDGIRFVSDIAVRQDARHCAFMQQHFPDMKGSQRCAFMDMKSPK
jgi:hypothetical protein